MIDQIIIGEKASFDDFGASLATRKIGQPPKKSVKETVPFSNITYDFSAINGEIFWEERELEYVFEMIAPTPELLEEAKMAFSNWVMNVMEQELQDPFIPEYHFKATFDDIEFEDDEGLDKTTATVKFTAYPYKIANVPRVFEVTIPANSTALLRAVNNSSHPITPTFTTDGNVMFTWGIVVTHLIAGTWYFDEIQFSQGMTELYLTNEDSVARSVSVSFHEEVF